MKITVANPSVAPHVQQTVKAYYEAGYLDLFCTAFFEHPDNKLSSYLKKIASIEKEINRRSFHDIPIEKFASRPLPELLRSLASRKLGAITTDKIWEWSELGFDKWVSSKLNAETDAVHTYEHAALATLTKAKALKKFCIYEQPSVHHIFFNNLAKQQLALYPELKSAAMALKVNHKADRRNSRRDRELELADLILCNSSFTRSTLIQGGIDFAKIIVNPLAFPPVCANGAQQSTTINKPVVFLHAGNQSITKASHIVYEAWRNCNFTEAEAELWLIGKMALPESSRKDLPGKVIIMDNIPHSDLMALYQQANVLIMPTLADGFGMVITEAMSQGVPVIASTNCCGPDVIEHMKDGWIIPAGNIDLLTEQLKWCVSNKQGLPQMGKAALEKASKWQWPQYKQKLSAIIFNRWEQFLQLKESV